MIGEILLFALLLAFSAFFSGSEMALSSMSEVKVRKLVAEKGSVAEPLLAWIAHPERFIATILIGNNIVNTAASALATIVTYRLVGGSEGIAVSVATGVTTLLVLTFGEITPKNFAKAHHEGMALFIIRPLVWLERILHPVVSAFAALSRGVVRITSRGRATMSGGAFSEEDLKASIHLGLEKGFLEGHEREMLTSVLEFSDTRAATVMAPRVEIIAVPIAATFDEIRRVAVETQYSRLPVFEETLDSVIGILHVRDLLGGEENRSRFDLRQYLRKPLFVPENMPLPAVLRQMKAKRLHMAMVVNEYGGIEGLVTLEDLLEELVGEIEDEHDESIALFERRTDGSIRVNAKIALREAARALGFELPETTVQSLGGFLIERAGRIPRRGDRITHEKLEFTVLEATRRRLLAVEARPTDGHSFPPEEPDSTRTDVPKDTGGFAA